MNPQPSTQQPKPATLNRNPEQVCLPMAWFLSKSEGLYGLWVSMVVGYTVTSLSLAPSLSLSRSRSLALSPSLSRSRSRSRSIALSLLARPAPLTRNLLLHPLKIRGVLRPLVVNSSWLHGNFFSASSSPLLLSTLELSNTQSQ